MKILLTGAAGFLGWHTRARLWALTDHQVLTVGRADWHRLADQARGVDAIIHVAGVNRAADGKVEHENVDLAMAVGDAARSSGSAPRIVFANSIRCGEQSPYGSGKAGAGDILESAAAELGSPYVDVRLPNLFGEHCRPHYNSFVATFVEAVVHGRTPEVEDRALGLLHVQAAAKSLIDGLTTQAMRLDPQATRVSVRGVLNSLQAFWDLYSRGDLPPLAGQFDIDLFNTMRAALFPAHYPIKLAVHSDDRGRLVEAVRSHGGQGQTFFSSTKPGATRGQHFHLGKFERFVVVSGTARIALRKLFTDHFVSFDVSGDDAVVVDMPTLWAHCITNTGSSELITMFWTNSLFDPSASDTYPENIGQPIETSRDTTGPAK